MTEKQVPFTEKEKQVLGESVDAQKANAQAVSQLDATLNGPKKTPRLQGLRSSTSDIETQSSRQKNIIRREAKAGESIDV